MRVVFMGTPDFAVPVLSEILTAGHEVAAVYTQPPRPAGRGMSERKSAVHAFADGSGIPVVAPKSLKGEAEQQAFARHRADVAVVVAYGLILPKPVLEAPRHGCLNLHASALPRWRGAAPIQRAIMAGDSETAATVMRMEAGLDTGPICLEERVPIAPDMTAGELHDLLAGRGARLMVRALANLERGHAAMPGAGGRRRHLRRQDRQGRGPHRLQPAGRRGAQPHPRPVAGPRGLVRGSQRGQARAHQGPARQPCARPWNWPGSAWDGPGRPADDCLR